MNGFGRLLGRPEWQPLPTWGVTNSKFARIIELCTGKDVLDCGCVGSGLDDPGGMASTTHYHIAAAARRCVGIDIMKDEVEKRRAAGYDVRVANAETMDLGETFDVIVAGDLIEHLSNPGLFLERARLHLRRDGLLCIVTPNPWSMNAVAKAVLKIETRINPEHTCWFDPSTLKQLLQRYGFEPLEWYWQEYGVIPVAHLLVRLRHNLASHFIAIAQKTGGD